MIAEEPDIASDGVRLYAQPRWKTEWPHLVQGTTAGADMSLFGSAPARHVTTRWLRLTHALRCDATVHARQVHEATVLVHDAAVRGVLIAGDADGHATARPRTLLAVSVADCVPIFLAAPARGVIALLHGGWRGVAAGILENGVRVLRDRFDVAAAELRLHLGPAICGACFEVGPEVPPQLGMEAPAGHSFIDLRQHLAQRAAALGVPPAGISISAHCTRCGNSPFYSHRGGCAERQIAVLGMR